MKLAHFSKQSFLPVMLSPMAGITNAPFRQLCREFANRAIYTCPLDIEANLGDVLVESGLYVDEMLSERAVVGRISKVRSKLTFAPNETYRSVQLYCRSPEHSYLAAKQVVSENLADHIDLNFGCPVRKVTSHGGGSAIPLHPKLLRAIINAVVQGAKDGANGEPALVSAKFRIGLDDEHINFLRTAHIAVEEGCQLLTLHARTTKQYYSGTADWDYITKLRQEVPQEVLVFGNGDIWCAADAQRMLEQTGADGVAIGRGALGRPWIFADLANLFLKGTTTDKFQPNLGQVVQIMLRHLQLTIDWMRDQHGEADAEAVAIRCFRANIDPYLKGFPVRNAKVAIMQAASYSQLEQLLNELDLSTPYPTAIQLIPRGRTKSVEKVYLPPNWLT